MKWWHWIFILLLIGAVGILSKFAWNRLDKGIQEGFQTPTQWNGLSLLQSTIYDQGLTAGISQYTIFDLERVEIQRRILEYEFGLFRKKIWSHEESFLNYVRNSNTNKSIFSRFLLSDYVNNGTSSTVTDNQRQTMRILFSYIFKFVGENPYQFAYRGYNSFDNDPTDIVNLRVLSDYSSYVKDSFLEPFIVKSGLPSSFRNRFLDIDISIKTDAMAQGATRNLLNLIDFELTGLESYIGTTLKENINNEFDLDALKNITGYILNGKKSIPNPFPPGSAPVVYSGLPSLTLFAHYQGYSKNSYIKNLWVCPATPTFGKPYSSRVVTRFLNNKVSHGYFLSLCSYKPDGPWMWDSMYNSPFYENVAYNKNMTSSPPWSRKMHQESVRDELVGGQVQVRGYTNSLWVSPYYRNQSIDTGFDAIRVPDECIVGFNVQYPDKFKEKALIGKNLLTDPVNWNESGLPISLFKYSENDESSAYVDRLIDAFRTSKGSDKTKYPWKGIPVQGTISQTNRDEINKSISICIPLNFSDPTTADKQLRIKSSDTRLYMSPNYSAMPEYTNKISTINGVLQMTLLQDQAAVTNNETNCNVQVTGEMLRLIPYHARNFITTWGDTRAERIQKYNSGGDTTKYDSTVKTVSNTVLKPTFDLASAKDLVSASDTTSITVAEKQAILNAMAQLYYDLGTGNRRIKMFNDVFQVGETIFDARYQVQEKISTDTQTAIRDLTKEYESLRNTTMTIDEVNRLEVSYQQKVADLYQQEEQNTANTGTNCGPRAKFIRISPKTAGKRLALSQVLASNNEGVNVARYGLVTPANLSTVTLFAGEETSGQQYGFDGRALPADKNTQFINSRNTTARQGKLPLLTDGVIRPRAVPNFYKSGATGPTDYIEINMGGESEITSVKVIYPQILEDDVDTTLTVTIYNANRQKMGESKDIVLSTATDAANREAVANFYFPTNISIRCARGFSNTFRVARFYASIRDTGRQASGRPDITKLSFTGFTESADTYGAAALSFNPLYNCGFDLPLDDPGGSQLYPPIIKYTKNFTNTTPANITCSDPNQVKSIMAEYRLSQRAQGFDTRADVRALTGTQAYDFIANNYFPSSVVSFNQINPSTCAFSFHEIVTDRVTNQPKPSVLRFGTFVMMPDTENWYSQKLTYKVADSRMYQTAAAYAAAFPANPLTAFTSPVGVPIPLVPRVGLDTGNGACPTKYCSDTDVINQLVVAYNMRTVSTQILRVNRAVSGGGLDGSSKRCDYEAVFGNFLTGSTTPQTFTDTISMFTNVNPTRDCQYDLISTSAIGQGYFADSNQPLLTKIYTYASEAITPFYNELTAAVSSLLIRGDAQKLETGNNITAALRTYRSDVLASYASINVLDGCGSNDTPVRCSDPTILSAFLQNFQQTNTDPEYITRILRGGAASGSECDFTYETNAGTRGARCKMVKPSEYCSFTFDSNYRPPETFHVASPGAGFTYEEAYNTCKAIGAELATTNQVSHALRMGADWCGTPGWVLDTAPDGNPVKKSPCAATSNLSETVAGKTDRAGINCYGAKPAATGSNTSVGRILPFNGTGATTWFQPVQQFLQGCMKMIPTPPTMDDLADLGYQPLTTSPLANSNLTTLSNAPLQPVVVDSVSPRDRVDCKSAYAIVSADQAGGATFAPFYAATTQRVEAPDAATCLYNRSIRVNFTKQNGVYRATSVQSVAPAATGGATEETLPTRITSRPTIPATNITTNSDCSNNTFLAASGMRSVVVDARRLDAGTCEYRVTKSDKLPFADSFKRVQFTGGNTAPFVTSVVNSVETTSEFRFFPDLAAGVTVAATQIVLANRLREFWNPKYFDTVTPTESVFRKRIGAASRIGYTTDKDSVFIQAIYAEYGPLGDLDIRLYNATQLFRVVYRKPNASFFQPTLDTAFVYSVELVSALPSGVTLNAIASDPDAPAITTPQAALTAESKFRMLRFTPTSPTSVELYRLNFYTISGTPPTTYTCPTNLVNTNAIQPVFMGQAYVTITDSGGKELRLGSYLPPAGTACDAEYTEGLDPRSQYPICRLDTNKLPAVDRPLYLYTRTNMAKPCQIGYTDDRTVSPPVCRLNYNMADLLLHYCASSPSTGAPRLELKANQSVVIYLYDTYTIHAYSITTGTNTKIPKRWKVEGSINGVTWATLHEQNTDYTFVDGTANPAGQFVTSQIFRWTGTPISTAPALSRPTATIEPFVAAKQPPTANTQERPSWIRIRSIEPHDASSKFVQIGAPLLFLTPSGYIDPAELQITNFGGTRRNPKEGPDALKDTVTANRRWVDYAKAPLLIRLPTQREPIRGLRFSLPATDLGALPKLWILEGSWDGRAWTPIQETTVPVQQDYKTVIRFEQPF